MDTNHRFYSLNSFLKTRHQQKVMKLALDCGFTCPNRDGTKGYGGCLFCSEKGSGDFTFRQLPSIATQLQAQIQQGKKKWPEIDQFMAYFQSYTNTYAPLPILQTLFEEVLTHPKIVGIAIATRPDCLPTEVVDYLENLHHRTHLWIELGLQSIHSHTTDFLNRGHNLTCFTEAVTNLANRGMEVVAHIILGLPGETYTHMLETAHYLASLPLQGVKIHMLHVLDDAPLGKIYLNNPFTLLTEQEYVTLVGDILAILPPHFVIHRLTGDGNKAHLIAPKWTLQKRKVLNHIHQDLKARNIIQGCYFVQK
jgi:radical SAM protein (TIGR01212 family)